MILLFTIWYSLLVGFGSSIWILPNFGVVAHFICCLGLGYCGGYLTKYFFINK